MAEARQHRAEEGAQARPTKGGAVRTRIALVAITPVALITTAVLAQAATVQPAQGAATPSFGVVATATTTTAVHHPSAHQSGDRPHNSASSTAAGSSLLLDVSPTLLDRAAASVAPAPAAPSNPVSAAATAPVSPAPAGPVDTVTPDQRAAWQRVAMCEEGGNWSADSPRFSGGLGISRTNWDVYGGRQFAPEGAMATEDQQIMVAERIQPVAPDQSGCRGW